MIQTDTYIIAKAPHDRSECDSCEAYIKFGEVALYSIMDRKYCHACALKVLRNSALRIANEGIIVERLLEEIEKA